MTDSEAPADIKHECTSCSEKYFEDEMTHLEFSDNFDCDTWYCDSCLEYHNLPMNISLNKSAQKGCC